MVHTNVSPLRCSQFDPPSSVDRWGGDPAMSPWEPATWWHGYHLIVPGHGSQDLLANLDSATRTTYPIVTKSHWRISCLTQTANGQPGEGFLAHAPDGTRYWFDELTYRPASTLTRPLWSGPLSATVDGDAHPNAPSVDFLQRRKGIMRVTRIEDRFGNWLTYDYETQGRLQAITAKDGRSLTIQYVTGTQRIDTVTVQPSQGAARIWDYSYDVGASPAQTRLTGVTLPDGSAWQFSLEAFDNASLVGGTLGNCVNVGVPGAASAGTTWIGTITHPSGLEGQFKIAAKKHGRSDVFRECRSVTDNSELSTGSYAIYPKAWYSFTLTERKFTGAGLPTRIWSYDYSDANDSWTDDPCQPNNCPTTVWTEVTRPDASQVRSIFSNHDDYTESQLLRVETYASPTASTPVHTVINTWASPTGHAWPATVGGNPQTRINADQTEQRSPLEKRQIQQNDDTYTWQALTFNSYAQVIKSSRDNDFDSQSALIETQSWRNDTSHWLLGLPLDHVNVSTGDTVRHNVYNTNSTLKERWAFGQKLMSYTWHTNGLLWTFTDANNHATTLTSYDRGIPQSILYADGTSQSLVVDDFGQVQNVTDETGDTTEYDYDDAGRLERISYPDDRANGVTWADRTIAYQFITTPERGITEDHWKRTVSAGNFRSVTYYSALWQAILTDTWDTTDSASHVNTRMRYDYAGRTVFQSWPVGGSPSISGITQGTTTDYDALGRVTATAQDSELGPLTTTTAYLADNQVKVTDPKSHATTTTYQAFDTPSYAKPIRVAFADDTVTTVSRDRYGKPLTMTQSGDYPGYPARSVTHRFVYDSYQRLCKKVSPESGQTALHYDAAGNLTWSAQGVTGAVTACTPEGSIPASRKIVRTYSARNRLLTVNYPAGEPDTAFTYYNDGKVHTASRGGITWTSTYFNRGLLQSDTLSIDGHSFDLHYDYDPLGHLSSEQYPSGQTVHYVPNAMGQPTQAGSWASLLDYAPNGRLTDLTYGNGITWQASYTTRNLLDTVQYARGTTLLADRDLDWDKNGNPTSITDSVNSTPAAGDTIFRNGFELPHAVGTDDRDYQYDNLDRLITAVSEHHGTRHYRYDPLGNLRRRWGNAAGPAITYSYDTGNRLSGLSTGLSLGYDGRGNTTTMNGPGGNVTLLYNHANELYYDSRGLDFEYDARGWRVKKTVNGTTTYTVYDANHHLVARLKGGTKTQFVSLGGRPIARIEDGTTTYIHTDYQNTPLIETDANGTPSRTPVYLAYGLTNAEGMAETPGYAGSTPDAATQLDYMGARYYYPIFGRFMSIDLAPLNPMSPMGLNRYAYASANPTRYIDPNGRNATAALGGLIVESWSFLKGDGFNGTQVLGALKDGYNGEGAGLGNALLQDLGTTSVVTGGGSIVKGVRVLAARKVETIGAKALSKEASKGIRSLKRRIVEHEKKLADFKKNPTPRPGTEGLSKDIQQKTIDGRIRHLEKEIDTFKNNIDKLREGK